MTPKAQDTQPAPPSQAEFRELLREKMRTAMWVTLATVYTPNNPDPQVIAKRVSFFGPSAEISNV